MLLSEKLSGKTIRNYADGQRPEGRPYVVPVSEPEIENVEDDSNDYDDDLRWDTEWDDPDENGIASLRAAHPDHFDDESLKDAIMQIAHCDEDTAYGILNWAEATNNELSMKIPDRKDDMSMAEEILDAYNMEDPDYDEDYIQYIDPEENLEEDETEDTGIDYIDPEENLESEI